MPRPCRLPTLVLLLLAASSPLTLSAEPPSEVVVRNLPAVQQIEGSVSVENLPEPSRFFATEAIIVPPVGRSETADLVSAGTIDSASLQSGQLSMHVESQGTVTKEGKVGVLLLPDRKPLLRSLNLENEILLATELQVDLRNDSKPVASQKPFQIAFPRYRIYLYNESNATAQVDLYVYLTR